MFVTGYAILGVKKIEQQSKASKMLLKWKNSNYPSFISFYAFINSNNAFILASNSWFLLFFVLNV